MTLIIRQSQTEVLDSPARQPRWDGMVREGVKGHGKLTLEDAEKAVPEIKKLKFLGQDKIKNQTLVIQLAPDEPK